MSVAARIREKLEKTLTPLSFSLIDESENHRGHAGYREGGETHFRLEIISESFRDRSRIERHRMIHDLLHDDLKDRIHALSIKALAPGE